MGANWLLILLSFTVVKSDITRVNFLQYRDFTIPDLDTICSFFPTAASVSEKCGQQLEIVCRNATLRMTMLDACSKFPYAGMGYTSRMDYGNFDQCLTIDHKYENGRILGEHCIGGLNIPDLITDNGTHLEDPDYAFKLAVCRPNGCSDKDYNAILKDLLPMIPYDLFLDYSCQTVESHTTWSDGDIAVLTIFLFIVGLMVLSTIYDLYLYHTGNKSAHPLLLSFSVLTNGRKLLHISKHSSSKEQIEVFHGLRVISMMWIVAGHALVAWSEIPVWNLDRITTWQKEMYALYITTSPLAVDTFFFMSGFLLAFQYFKGKARTFTEQVAAIPHIVLHRYLRLTPAMVMIFLVLITFYVHMGNGPVWMINVDDIAGVCRKGWWRFLLYIQNYYDLDDMCIVQTWYLAADMQLFVLSPIVLIPLSLQLKNIGLRKIMLEMLIFYTLVLAIVLAEKFCSNDTNGYDTQTRFLIYFIGVWLGLFMRVTINEPFLYTVKKSRRSTVNLITWVVILLGLLTVIICYQDQILHHGSNSQTAFYLLMRPAWAVGLSWITYSCYHGHGGFVNWILCRPIFQVLARLTYCIYLTHINVLLYYLSMLRHKVYFSDYNAFYRFCGDYTVSVILSTFWTLAFESPVIIIEKHLFGQARQTKKEATLPQNGSKEDQNGSKGEPSNISA